MTYSLVFGNVQFYNFQVYNRWGQVIYQTSTPGSGWNGTYKGKAAASDAYVYVVEFVCENGSIIPFKGNVTLVR